MPIAGKIMPRPMGDYSPSEIYKILDIVNYQGKPWICKKDDVQNIAPSEQDPHVWQALFNVDMTNADTLDGKDSSYFAVKKETTQLLIAEFDSGKWSADAPYTQTVNVTGMKSTDTPIPVFIDVSSNINDSKAFKKAYACVTQFDSGNGTVKATCKYTKPTRYFKVGFKGV